MYFESHSPREKADHKGTCVANSQGKPVAPIVLSPTRSVGSWTTSLKSFKESKIELFGNHRGVIWEILSGKLQNRIICFLIVSTSENQTKRGTSNGRLWACSGYSFLQIKSDWVLDSNSLDFSYDHAHQDVHFRSFHLPSHVPSTFSSLTFRVEELEQALVYHCQHQSLFRLHKLKQSSRQIP